VQDFDRVFVATDQQQYVDRLRSRYGARLIHQDCLRSTDGRNPMWLQRRSPAAQGKEVLLDALLLSRCAFMLKSPSAVSEFAHYFRPTLRSLDLNEHRTEFAGQSYTKPGLGYGRYPNAWDAVGGGEQEPGQRSKREVWVEPIIIRSGGR
jgi:hypothetical protein